MYVEYVFLPYYMVLYHVVHFLYRVHRPQDCLSWPKWLRGINKCIIRTDHCNQVPTQPLKMLNALCSTFGDLTDTSMIGR